MSKPLFGLVLGGVLGIFDGLTALFTPAVRSQIVMIVIGSMFKGLIAGVADRMVRPEGRTRCRSASSSAGSVGLLLAWLVASMPQPDGKHYYFEIMLPGAIVGLIVGYATQRYRAPAPQRA